MVNFLEILDVWRRLIIFQILNRSSGISKISSLDVCEMFGVMGIPMIVVVHPEGKH